MTTLKKADIEPGVLLQVMRKSIGCIGIRIEHVPAVSQKNASMFVWYVIVQKSCAGLKRNFKTDIPADFYLYVCFLNFLSTKF
jgi:hypothetical protein